MLPEFLKPSAICFGDWGLYFDVPGFPGDEFVAPLTQNLALHLRRQEPRSDCFLVAGLLPTPPDGAATLPAARGVLWDRRVAVKVEATFQKMAAKFAAMRADPSLVAAAHNPGESMLRLSDSDSILDLAVQLSLARDVPLNQAVDEIFAARETILMSAAKIKETVS